MITMSKKHARLIASGLGSGYAAKAPGTFGSIAAFFPGLLLWYYAGNIILLIAVLLLLGLACYVCAILLDGAVELDPAWIVVDEWLGLWLGMAVYGLLMSLFMSDTAVLWQDMLIILVLFRIFDILKPWPISALEHIGPAWWSIQADDLFAGICASASLFVIDYLLIIY
ncbi:MAG: phosphatidylglycerophosphatase A [Mariprofundales bacterium]